MRRTLKEWSGLNDLQKLIFLSALAIGLFIEHMLATFALAGDTTVYQGTIPGYAVTIFEPAVTPAETEGRYEPLVITRLCPIDDPIQCKGRITGLRTRTGAAWDDVIIRAPSGEEPAAGQFSAMIKELDTAYRTVFHPEFCVSAP